MLGDGGFRRRLERNQSNHYARQGWQELSMIDVIVI